MAGGNPYPYRSREWEQHNAEEIAARPTAILNRKPFSPDELASLRAGVKMEEVLAARSAQQVPNDGAR